MRCATPANPERCNTTECQGGNASLKGGKGRHHQGQSTSKVDHLAASDACKLRGRLCVEKYLRVVENVVKAHSHATHHQKNRLGNAGSNEQLPPHPGQGRSKEHRQILELDGGKPKQAPPH